MSEVAWFAWAERHGDLFGLTADGDARMFRAWVQFFAKAGFQPEDLHEATEWLATNATPRCLRSRSDHLLMLRDRLQSRRDERARAKQQQQDREKRRRRLEAVRQVPRRRTLRQREEDKRQREAVQCSSGPVLLGDVLDDMTTNHRGTSHASDRPQD